MRSSRSGSFDRWACVSSFRIQFDDLRSQENRRYLARERRPRNFKKMLVMGEEEHLSFLRQLAKNFKTCCCSLIIKIDKKGRPQWSAPLNRSQAD